jgi:hypothetical protein
MTEQQRRSENAGKPLAEGSKKTQEGTGGGGAKKSGRSRTAEARRAAAQRAKKK